MRNLIVNFAPTGMVPTKDMTPNVPVSVNEIIENVHEAVELGITIVHLHARDPLTGRPTYRAEVYGDLISGIRRHAEDLVICVSLSGRDFGEFYQRSEPLQLTGHCKPDMGSLTLSSLNFTGQASINAPEMVQALATEMKAKGIKPELEAFDLGMINYAKYLIGKGILTGPHYLNILLGNIAGAQLDTPHIAAMLSSCPAETIWSMGGLGNAQLSANSIAIALGGGVRVGLEDTIWYDQKRTRLATNIGLLRRVHELADIHERAIMPPSQLRNLLNLNEGYGNYGSRAELEMSKAHA